MTQRRQARSSWQTTFSVSSRALTSFTGLSSGSSTSASRAPTRPSRAAKSTAPTKKFGNQKGGGGARHGSRKAGIFVGGGKAFGPRSRSHETSLNKKVRALGLRHALSSKAKASEIIIIDKAEVKEAKTKLIQAAFAKLGWVNALIIDGATVNEGFANAARNIPNIDVLPVQGINVYDILRRKNLVLTKAAVEALEARFK